MGQFKRELTYAGDVSKLTNIQKKRVSSISQEADATTWLGDDVLGVEVIKYDVNGYSVNVKREESSRGYFCFFSPFPCTCKCIVNNFNPNKIHDTEAISLLSQEFTKLKDGTLDVSENIWQGQFVDTTNNKGNVRESLYIFNSGFHFIRVANNYNGNVDCTFVFYPLSITSYKEQLNNNPIFTEDVGGVGANNITFVQNRKNFIKLLGLKSTLYIRLVNLDAINYVAFRSSTYQSLYTFGFVLDRNNKELGKSVPFKRISTFDDLTKVLDGSHGKGTIIIMPFSAKNAALNNYETPTGKPALSYTTYTKDSPEIAKLTEIYNSIK